MKQLHGDVYAEGPVGTRNEPFNVQLATRSGEDDPGLRLRQVQRKSKSIMNSRCLEVRLPERISLMGLPDECHASSRCHWFESQFPAKFGQEAVTLFHIVTPASCNQVGPGSGSAAALRHDMINSVRTGIAIRAPSTVSSKNSSA